MAPAGPRRGATDPHCGATDPPRGVVPSSQGHRSVLPASAEAATPRVRAIFAAKPMIVEKRRVDGFVLLHVEGVIKLGESARFFADTLKRVLAEEKGHVLIDLAKINYIDSTGIGELVGYLGRFQEAKRKLILIEPSEHIRKLLRVAHLDELFPIYDSLDDALDGEAVARAP